MHYITLLLDQALQVHQCSSMIIRVLLLGTFDQSVTLYGTF